jgi:hypothetical protein
MRSWKKDCLCQRKKIQKVLDFPSLKRRANETVKVA